MNIRVTFPGGQSRDFPAGTPMAAVAAHEAFPEASFPLVALSLNNEVVSLQHPLSVNCTVGPVDLGSRAGLVIYRRSLCLLLSMAAARVFPKRWLVIGHSLGQGYLFYFDGLEGLAKDDVVRIEAAMREIVAKDMPIHALSLSYREAIEYFEKHLATLKHDLHIGGPSSAPK